MIQLRQTKKTVKTEVELSINGLRLLTYKQPTVTIYFVDGKYDIHIINHADEITARDTLQINAEVAKIVSDFENPNLPATPVAPTQNK